MDVLEALAEREALDLDELVAHHVSLHLLSLPTQHREFINAFCEIMLFTVAPYCIVYRVTLRNAGIGLMPL